MASRLAAIRLYAGHRLLLDVVEETGQDRRQARGHATARRRLLFASVSTPR